MWTDAVDLRDFYATSLGSVARRMIRRRIRAVWPDVTGQSLLGLGYTTPFLNPFRSEAARILAAMPASQGSPAKLELENQAALQPAVIQVTTTVTDIFQVVIDRLCPKVLG